MDCALKMLMSIPALLSTVFNYCTTADDETGLCGLILAISNCLLPFGECFSDVLFTYSCSAKTGQSLLIELRKEEFSNRLCLTRLLCQLWRLEGNPLWAILSETDVQVCHVHRSGWPCQRQENHWLQCQVCN